MRRVARVVGWITLNFLGGIAISGLTLWKWQYYADSPAETLPAVSVASAPPAADSAAPAPTDPVPVTREEQVQRAKELLVSGAGEEAGRAYDALLQGNGDSASLNLLYARALCWEISGDVDRAVEAYRQLAEGSGPSTLKAAAQLGQARSGLRLRRASEVRAILLSLALSASVHPQVAADACHLLAQATTMEAVVPDSDPFDDGVAMTTVLLPRPAQVLELLQATGAEVTLPDPATQVQVVAQSGPDPHELRLRVAAAGSRATDLLDAIAKQTHLDIQTAARARHTLQTQPIDLHTADMDLATVLDGLLEPSGLTWRQSANVIHVEIGGSLDGDKLMAARREQAERYCRMALADHPDRPLALATRFALGNLRFAQQDYEAAVIAYKQVVESREDKLLVRDAWFNLAKAYLCRGQFEPSRQAFLKAADLARGQTLEPVAYLYLGRLLLDDEQIEEAIRQLVRAESLARDPRACCRSAMTLASAYLLSGNPPAANTTLMNHRDVLKASPEQAEAAFLGALARFRGTAHPAEIARRGRVLINALSHVEPARFFGSTGYLLLGQAHDELGLPSQMEEVYREALRVNPANLLRDRIQFELAQRLAENRQWPQAKELLQTLVDVGGSHWKLRARFSLAELALEQDQFEDCLHWCYELVDIPMSADEKQALLKLMGRAYERQADHLKAALCFAGLVPVPVADLTP